MKAIAQLRQRPSNSIAVRCNSSRQVGDAPVKKEPTWIRIVRAPVLAIGFVISIIYAGLLGWWLDKLVAKRSDERLANDVRQNLAFLFNENCGQIVPCNDYQIPRAFDLALVTVATQDFWIRFARVSGEFNVEVGSTQAPHRWEDLSGALESAEMQHGATLNDVVKTRPSRAYSSFADVARLLKTHWPVLQQYCANC